MGDVHQYLPSVAKPGPTGQPGEQETREVQRSRAYWDEAVRQSPLQRLRYYDARLARAGFSGDPAERERVKERVAELIREVGASVVLTDPDVISMVRELFGERGVQRLKDRATAKPREPNVVDNLVRPVG